MDELPESCGIAALAREHRQIERVLDALNVVIARGVEAERPLDPALIRRFVEFIERFADGRHHAKEEGVLFREMHAHGFSIDSGPLACMLAQHELGRHFTGELRAWTEAPPETQLATAAGMLAAAHAYQALLFKHIGIEDGLVFPTALAELPRSTLVRIAARCRELEPPGAAGELAAAADELVSLVKAWRADRT